MKMDRKRVEAEIQELQLEIDAAIEIMDNEYTRITFMIEKRNALQKRIKRSDAMRAAWKRKKQKGIDGEDETENF